MNQTLQKQSQDHSRDGLKLLTDYRGAIMGFAALWIYLFHEWQTVLGDVACLAWTEAFIKRIGFVGVDIFLMLSGMGLTYAIGKGKLWRFYYRRLRRVYLPFLAVGLCHLLRNAWDAPTFWGNITGWNFYAKSMYSFLWFVPAIMTLYILFPLYYRIFTAHKQPLNCLLGSLALWLLLSIALRNTLRYDLFGFTNRIPIFLIGIYFGWCSQNDGLQFTGSGWCLLALTGALGVYLAYETSYKGYYLLVPTSNCCLPNILMAVSLPFFLAQGLKLLHGRGVRWLGAGLNRGLRFFGLISLELYCIQEALGWELIPMLYRLDCGPLAVNALMFGTTVLAALVMYLLFDGFWKLLEMPGKRKATHPDSRVSL